MIYFMEELRVFPNQCLKLNKDPGISENTNENKQANKQKHT